MELGLLNLMPGAGVVDDAGFALPETVDGDAFTALIAQLGLAPTAPAGAVPAAEELAAKLAGLPGAILSPKPAAKMAADAAVAPDDTTAPDAGADDAANPLDLAALGLPPLMTAMLAPTPQATSAAPVAAGAALPAPTGVVATALAVPIPATIDAPPAAAAPVELAKAAVAEPPVAIELAPLATLARRPAGAAAATVPMIGTQRASKGDGGAAASADPAPLLIARTSQPPIATPTAPAETLSIAQPGVEPAPALELPIEAQLDLARDGEWLDQLAKDIARTATGDGTLRFKLNPEHLGSLQVEVTQGAAGASVRLTADTEAARTLIADARPQLIAEARAQGVRIAEAHVDLGSGSQSHGGGAQRDGRDLPERTYLTSWQPESAEEDATPPRRSASERYA